MLTKAREGRDALLVADTGAGKTLAGFLPTLCDFAASAGQSPEDGLHSLYVSPLKALAHDVKRNLLTPIEEIGLPIRVETRSGDTSSDKKKRQREKPPHVMLTTPESLKLLRLTGGLVALLALLLFIGSLFAGNPVASG